MKMVPVIEQEIVGAVTELKLVGVYTHHIIDIRAEGLHTAFVSACRVLGAITLFWDIHRKKVIVPAKE